jgi:hypothetical protein
MSIHFTLLVLMKAKLINTRKPAVFNANTLDEFPDGRKEIDLSIHASFMFSD